MSVTKPYRRTYRPSIQSFYPGDYITHPKFAQSPEHYIRAFLLILKDLQDLFDYIEPADTNLDCYSYRIHALLLRTCVEVEANCKAILTENGFTLPLKKDGTMQDMTIKHYSKINFTHRLSSYQVKIPNWSGIHNTRTPFLAWANRDKKQRNLAWYTAYNTTKHDRHKKFEEATF